MDINTEMIPTMKSFYDIILAIYNKKDPEISIFNTMGMNSIMNFIELLKKEKIYEDVDDSDFVSREEIYKRICIYFEKKKVDLIMKDIE